MKDIQMQETVKDEKNILEQRWYRVTKQDD